MSADDPEDARAAIEATVGAAEPQLVPDALSQLGTILVWDSETLIERSGMMATDWPIPAPTLRSLRIPEHSVSGSGDIRSAIPTHPVTGSRRR